MWYTLKTFFEGFVAGIALLQKALNKCGIWLCVCRLDEPHNIILTWTMSSGDHGYIPRTFHSAASMRKVISILLAKIVGIFCFDELVYAICLIPLLIFAPHSYYLYNNFHQQPETTSITTAWLDYVDIEHCVFSYPTRSFTPACLANTKSNTSLIKKV